MTKPADHEYPCARLADNPPCPSCAEEYERDAVETERDLAPGGLLNCDFMEMVSPPGETAVSEWGRPWGRVRYTP